MMKPCLTEEADPGPVGERKSDQILAEPAQRKIVELQPVGDMLLAIRPAEVKQGIVGAEIQQAAAAKHPGCLGHRPVGVGKRHRDEIAETMSRLASRKGKTSAFA